MDKKPKEPDERNICQPVEEVQDPIFSGEDSLKNKAIRLVRQRNKGFDAKKEFEKIDMEGDHYSDLGGELSAKFGGFKVIKEDGNWRPDFERVIFEAQQKSVESMFCTVFNTENCVQALQIALYNEFEEYDEIPLANLAGVSPYKGGSPHSVAEALRKYGLFKAGTYPFTDQMRSKNDLVIKVTDSMLAVGQEWLKKWNFGHEWIYNITPSKLLEMLKTSPIGAGVYAWNYDSNKGVYTKPSWATDNHWTCVIVGAEVGKYWWVYDSYKDFSGTPFKKLDWNYPFAFAKRYWLEKKTIGEYDEGRELYNRLKGKIIMRSQAAGEMYEVLESGVVQFAGWWTNSPRVQSILDRGLREEQKAGRFIGISEADWVKLENSTFVKINDYLEITGYIEQLKKLEGKNN